MILLLLGLLAAAGPVDDARSAIQAHSRGRDVAPLVAAITALREGQTQGMVPKDAPTYEVTANAAFLAASDGPEKSRTEHFDLGITALELAAAAPGPKGELGPLTSSYALLATRELRQAPQHADWPAWTTRAKRILAAGESLTDPGGASLRGQLADQIARFPDQPAKDAARFALIALAADHTSATRIEILTEALLQESAFDLAADLATRGVARYPSSKMNALAGAALLRAGKLDPSIAYLKAAQQGELTGQVQVAVARDLALVYVKLQKVDEAIPALKAAISLDPKAANLHYELGRIHAMRATTVFNNTSGEEDAKRAASKPHFEAAIPHLQAALSDPRYEPHARAALTVCQAQVAPPSP